MTTPGIHFTSIEQQADFEKWKAQKDKLPRTKGKAIWTQAEKDLTLKRLEECYTLVQEAMQIAMEHEDIEPYPLAQTISDSDEETNSQLPLGKSSFVEKPLNKKPKKF